jgi:hypothetical protein
MEIILATFVMNLKMNMRLSHVQHLNYFFGSKQQQVATDYGFEGEL